MVYLFVPIILTWLTVLPFAVDHWRRGQHWRKTLRQADRQLIAEQYGSALYRNLH